MAASLSAGKGSIAASMHSDTAGKVARTARVVELGSKGGKSDATRNERAAFGARKSFARTTRSLHRCVFLPTPTFHRAPC